MSVISGALSTALSAATRKQTTTNNERKNMRKASIGRIVHYVLADGPYTCEHRPAIITRVLSNTCVNLMVLTDSSGDGCSNDALPCVMWRSCVNIDDATGKSKPLPGTWHWPEVEAVEDLPILKDDQPPLPRTGNDPWKPLPGEPVPAPKVVDDTGTAPPAPKPVWPEATILAVAALQKRIDGIGESAKAMQSAGENIRHAYDVGAYSFNVVENLTTGVRAQELIINTDAIVGNAKAILASILTVRETLVDQGLL